MLQNNPEMRAVPRDASAPERADIALAVHFGKHRRHPAMKVVAAVSELGDQPPLLLLSSAALAYGFWSGDVRATIAGGRMTASVLLATGIKQGLKRLFARTRPHVFMDGGGYELRTGGPNKGPWQSFPSGHTAGSVAAARALARSVPEAKIPAYAVAGAIALAQVPRGAHYPSDVAAGLVIGLAAEALVEQVAEAWSGRESPESRLSRTRPFR